MDESKIGGDIREERNIEERVDLVAGEVDGGEVGFDDRGSGYWRAGLYSRTAANPYYKED